MKKWISVRDRLPENGIQVLVLLHTKEIRLTSVQYQNITCADHEIIQIRTWHNIPNEQAEYWTTAPAYTNLL